MASNQGDFKDKQFEEKEVADKVVEQYDTEQARVFYKYVMGGGGMDIHYGVFTKPTDTVYESSKETNHRLMMALHWAKPITEESLVLDLGSGHGGLSHELATTYKCSVMGANISPAQNAMNLAEAEKLGVADKISVTLNNFNEGLPADWTDKFTHVISCEVLCHAANKGSLFDDLQRVMKPGAAFAFTDIMGAEGADEKVLKDFTDRNATTKMARPTEYLDLLKEKSFIQGSFLDYSQHLLYYFKSMVDQIELNRENMVKEGVTDAYLDKWMSSLTSRVEIQEEHKVFAWGIFACRTDGPIF